jgi:hypothetical protein
MARRVNLIISDAAYTDLKQLSAEDKRTMTEIVRLGVGLYKVARKTEAEGRRLIVASADGNPICDILIPR